MKRAHSIVCRIIAASLIVPQFSWACEELGNKVLPEFAVKYVGFVKDSRGRAVAKATILTSLGEEFAADERGRFAISFGIDRDSDDIVFVCKKDGYESISGAKTQSQADKLTILITCLMKPA